MLLSSIQALLVAAVHLQVMAFITSVDRPLPHIDRWDPPSACERYHIIIPYF